MFSSWLNITKCARIVDLEQSLIGTKPQYVQKNREHSGAKTWITCAFRMILSRVIRLKENEAKT